ncbi:RepB family protein [Klebsiella pneumoniae]
MNVFIDKQLKDDLVQLCETTGLTELNGGDPSSRFNYA